MATDFSIEDYFTNRINRESSNPSFSLENRPSKTVSLEAASAEKSQALAGLRQQKQQAMGSWAGKLGLSEGDFGHSTVNSLASLASGTARVAGDLVSLVAADLPAMGAESALTEAELQAGARYQRGEATEADVDLLTQYKDPRTSELRRDGSYRPSTALELFERAVSSRKRGAAINDVFDGQNWVDQSSRQTLDSDLTAGFNANSEQVKQGVEAFKSGNYTEGAIDTVSGVGGLLFRAVEAAFKNPQASSEYIVENIPQLALGALGKAGQTTLAASNVGYAAENYQKGINKYREDNNGEYPPEEQRLEMAMWAASTGLAEQVSDVATIGLTKLGSAVARNAATTGLAGAARGVAGATVTGTAVEAATEGFQTYAEGQASLAPVTAEEIYRGAAIGGIAGGGMSGGGRAIAEALKPNPEKAAQRAQEKAVQDAADAAIASGDVTPLVDPQSPVYAPEKAVSALYQASKSETATDETKQSNLVQAQGIVDTLQSEQTSINETLGFLTMKPEEIAEIKTELASVQEQINNAPEGTDTSAQQEMVAYMEQMVRANELTTEEKTALKAASMKVERTLKEAQKVLTAFTSEQVTPEVVESTVTAVNAPIDVNNQEQVQTKNAQVSNLINLSMASPDRITPAQVEALVSNTDNGLTQPQRDYLRSFNEARSSEERLLSMGEVSERVYFGKDKDVGIKQYRERITSALANGEQTNAAKQLNALTKFSIGHTSKAQAAAEAWAQGKGTQIARDKNGQWAISDVPLTKEQIKNRTGLTLNSEQLVNNIGIEATAVNAAVNEMQNAFNLRYPRVNSTTGGTNVQNVQAPANQSQEQVQQDLQRETAKDQQETPRERPAARTRTTESTPREVTTEVTTTDTDVADSSVESDSSVQETPSQLQSVYTVPSSLDLLGFSEQTQKLGNMFEQNLTLQVGKDSDSSKRPLASVKDFMSTAFNKARDYLPEMGEFTEKQKRAFKTFKAVAADWSPKITNNLVRHKNPDFWFRDDVLQYAMSEVNGKLDLDENIKTAMAYSGYSWVAENAGRVDFNTDEEINSILGRDEDTVVTEEERDSLSNLGTRQNIVVSSLGRKAIQAAGLKAKKDAGQDFMPKLESAIGARILALLLNEGIAVRTVISGQEFSALTKDGNTDINASHAFIKLDDGTRKVEQIIEAVRGSQDIIDKLFGVESALKEPTLEPVDFTQSKTKGTNQNVPSDLAATLDKKNKEKNFIREDMWSIINRFDPNIFIQIAGGSALNPETTHVKNLRSQEAKNKGLLRELENMKAFVNNSLVSVGLDTPFYLQHNVWRQQRVGITNNAFNPQTSKIHRHSMYRSDWATEVNLNNDAEMINFRLRVAEGMGVKVDKKSNAKALEEYAKIINDPVIKTAVATLRKSVQEGTELTQEDQNNILLGVKKGGESMHSFDALMALAEYQNAVINKSGKFTTYLVGEVDGVTNGPMLSHLLLGAASTVDSLFDILRRGGFYTVNDSVQNYNMWRSLEGNFDLYETTAKNMTIAVNKMFKKRRDLSILSSIYFITGQLTNDEGVVQKAGRDIVKTPLTAMVFGSSMKKSVDGMADKFIDTIYKRMEQAAKGEITTDSLISNLNNLGLSIDPKTDAQTLLQKELTSDQIETLKGSFNATLGKAVRATLETDFASFLEKRTEFNTAAQTAYELYNAVYEGIRSDYIDELVANDQIPTRVNKKGEVELLRDLTIAEEADLKKRIQKMAPVMHTANSKKSGKISGGLQLSKTITDPSTNPMYQSNISFANPIAGTQVWSKSAKKYVKQSSMGTNAVVTRTASPGVAAMVLSTHALDSDVSQTASMKTEALNIHDAHGTGPGNVKTVSENLNQALWESMLNYSSPDEVRNALYRSIVGVADLISNNQLSETSKENLIYVLNKLAGTKEVDVSIALEIIANDTASLAYEANTVKYGAMAIMGAVDQYAMQDGQYVVTDTDRAAAQAKLSEATARIPRRVQEAIETIQDSITGEPKPQATPEVVIEVDTNPSTEAILEPVGTSVNEVIDEIANTNPEFVGVTASNATVEQAQEIAAKANAVPSHLWGDTGTPTIESDPTVVEMFADGNQDVIVLLRRMYSAINKSEDPNKQFNLDLIKQLVKVINPALKAVMVTPNTNPDDVLAAPQTKSRGWYVAQGTQEAVYFTSPKYVHSGLTTETVLHELTHSAVARVIEQELANKKADPNYKSDALDLVNDLEALRKKAKEYAQSTAGAKYDAALTNVHEFVAWGMTNQDFQTNVLQKISMQSKTKGNPLVKGMKAFITALTGLIFKNSGKPSQAITVNGMTILIGNTSGLMAESARVKTQATQSMMLSQETAAVDAIQAYTTSDIYEAVSNGSVSAEFDAHLQSTLNNIVEKLHGPYGAFKATAMKDAASTPLDAWAKALNTSEAPFASQLLASPLTVSEQEAFVMQQVEATVKAAMTDVSQTSIAYKQLSDLYTEVKAKLKPSDFKSQDAYDFVFKIEKSNGDRSDYLARFAALALGHQEFNRLMNFASQREVTRLENAQTFSERVQAIFESILNFFYKQVVGTYNGQPANEKLTNLINKLVDIEAKKKTALAAKANRRNITGNIEDSITDLTAKARTKLGNALTSDFVNNNRSGIVRGIGGIARTVANDRVDLFYEGFARIRDNAIKKRHGILMGLVNELRGPKEFVQALHRETKDTEKMRKSIITDTAKVVLGAFTNEGKDLNNDQKKALSYVMLRTGMHYLTDTMTGEDIVRVMKDKKELNREINAVENDLRQFGNMRHYYINQANVLGYFKATGKARGTHLMMNAHNIASAFDGVGMTTVSPADVAKATPLIQKLVTLYALDYSDEVHLADAISIYETENQRSNENGVEFLLKMHKKMEQDSLERLFNNNPTQMIHGYLPDITNPNTAIAVATQSEGKDLMDLGYSKGSPVQSDRHDMDQSAKHIYVLKDGGLLPYVSGAFSFTGLHSKGSSIHDGFTNMNYPAGQANNVYQSKVAMMKSTEITKLYSNRNREDLRMNGQNNLVPTLDDKGRTVNYRYMMNEETKDNLLERDNSFEKLIGSLAGGIYDKEAAPAQNAMVISALKEDYDNNFAQLSSSFSVIGPKSSDPAMREIWRMIPDSAKQEIKRQFGREEIILRTESIDPIFGYRKYSLANVFDKNPEDRKHLEKLFAWGVEWILENYARVKLGMNREQAADYSKRAANVVTKAERVWQEIVREVKDIIVVKSGLVLLGNIWSNVSLLALRGMSIKDIVSTSLVALKGATNYQRDTHELAKWKSYLEAGYTNGNEEEIRRNILRLEDSIARNPVKPLIDAGLMPTIVDDVSMDEDIYSYKSAFARSTDKWTSKLNPKVRQAGKFIYMTHDTKMYQGLSRITQLSDFVGRYSLYQHLTTRSKDPLNHEQAVQKASDAFINYDIPMVRGLQYMDDMGLMMFTKYFFRIQRVLFEMGRENPTRVLGAMALGQIMDLGPIVLDSSAILRLGNNPFATGALQFPGTLDELMTINSAVSLIK